MLVCTCYRLCYACYKFIFSLYSVFLPVICSFYLLQASAWTFLGLFNWAMQIHRKHLASNEQTNQ